MKKIIILFLILGAQQLFSQNLSEFTNISSVDDISCVSEIDERKIFFGSSGGIIDFNPVNEEYSILNASNNILDLNVTCIERISEDIVVIGTYAGKLYLLNSENNNVIKYYTDLENNVLVDLHTQNDTLWVAADDFISVFKIIGNTLQFIDLFTSFPVSVEHFSTLNIFKNELYVGASNVFMKVPADYGMYNLKDKSIWQPISIYGNNSPAVRDLLVNGQELLVGSSQGIYSLTNNNSSVSITLINSGNVNKISVKNEILYWSNSTNIVKKEGDVIETIMTAGSTIYDFVVNDSKVYTVTSHSGIYMQKDSVTQKRFSVFPENVVGEIAINSAGDYYVTNSPLPLNKSNGCFKWNGEKSTQYYWKRLNGSSWGRMNMVRFIKEVIPGQFLMCSWGGGFWIVDENEDKFIVMNNQTGDFELQIKEYDGNEYNITPVPDEKIEFLPNILTNISGQDDYAIANYAVTDNYNNFVWICQFESENDLIALGFPIVNEKVYW
ncbi:MAG: hypothetical protein KAR38_17925, partial [Calditrichia bacterium]|nr:hypothetical protein [Calditrichia bacterium]